MSKKAADKSSEKFSVRTEEIFKLSNDVIYFMKINELCKVGVLSKSAEFKLGEDILSVSCPGNYVARLYLAHHIDAQNSKIILRSCEMECNLKVKRKNIYEGPCLFHTF